MTQRTSNTDSDSDYVSLVAGIKRLLTDKLRELMTGMVDSTNDRLFEFTGSTQDNAERNHYYELMRKFRDYKPLFFDEFFINLEKLLRPYGETEREKNALKEGAEDELSLVDQDVMEGIVLVESMGERIEGELYVTLSELEKRFAYLAGKTSEIFEKDALAPIHLCQAFDDALGKGFDIKEKKPLFQIFNDVVAKELGTTYDDINKLLINAGILPDLKPQAKKNPVSANSQNNQPQQDLSEENFHQQGADGYAMTASPGHGHAADQDSANHPGNTAADNMSGTQMSEVISNFIGTPIGPGSSGGPDENASASNSSAQAYGQEEILSALSGIQNNPEFNQPDNIGNDAEAIKQAVLSQIAASSGGAVTKRINQIAEKTINFIELIFDAIIEDENISDTIKTLLLRLQIPVIKAAMVDHEFFLSDTHPARVLLDRISEVGIGVTDHTDDIYIALDELITRLVSEFELNTDTFKKTLDELNALEEERNKEASEKEEETQKQVLREHARSTVLKALRKITAGKRLPEAVHPLVLKRWPTLMYNHYLTRGKENDEWVVINELLKDIVGSVQPIDSAEEMVQLIAIRHKLTAAAYEYFNRTSQSKQDIHNVIKGLEDAHSAIIDNSEFSIEQVDASDDSIDTTYTLPEAEDHQPEKEEKPVPPTGIMPGMWFKVYMGEDNAARRCKLSVIIAADAKLVFVNYQGEILVEKSFDEFDEEMKNEKSKVIMGHSAFDHALNRVVKQLNPAV